VQRINSVIVAALCVLLAAACSVTPVATPTSEPPTPTVIPTATTTITPVRPAMMLTPAAYPTPTTDPRDPVHASNALRTDTWPVGTAAIAMLGTGTGTVDVDTAAVVLTAPIPQGTDVAFYFAVPPRRDYAGFVTFPASRATMMLQPGDTIRLIGRAAGAVPLPPVQGNGMIVNVVGVRFVRGDAPLS